MSKKNKIDHELKSDSKIKISSIIIAILAVLFVISIATSGFSKWGFSDKQTVADETIKAINQNILQGQATATLKSVDESNGLYNIKMTINGKDVTTYVTKDGKVLFQPGAAIDLTAQPQQQQTATTQTTTNPKTDNPDIKLFTMAFCPYGNQAEDGIFPAIAALNGKVNVEPHYVIYSNYGGGGPQYCFDSENKYCSMHAIQELHEDIRELCVYKYQKDKYWDFVLQINKQCNAQNADTCWENVAKQYGIDTAKVTSCYNNEATDLLKNEVAIGEKYGVQGSPTLMINGVSYDGGRTPEAFKQGLCSAFNTPPNECSQTLSGSATAQPAGGCGTPA